MYGITLCGGKIITFNNEGYFFLKVFPNFDQNYKENKEPKAENG